jgi:hypothetical protein
MSHLQVHIFLIMKTISTQIYILGLFMVLLWLGSCSMDANNAPVAPATQGIGGSLAPLL